MESPAFSLDIRADPSWYWNDGFVESLHWSLHGSWQLRNSQLLFCRRGGDQDCYVYCLWHLWLSSPSTQFLALNPFRLKSPPTFSTTGYLKSYQHWAWCTCDDRFQCASSREHPTSASWFHHESQLHPWPTIAVANWKQLLFVSLLACRTMNLFNYHPRPKLSRGASTSSELLLDPAVLAHLRSLSYCWRWLNPIQSSLNHPHTTSHADP